MNKTLRKILEELDKEQPRLDYIKGMLEVLIEGDITVKPSVQLSSIPTIPVNPSATRESVPMEEAEMLDNIARAKLEEVKKMSL